MRKFTATVAGAIALVSVFHSCEGVETDAPELAVTIYKPEIGYAARQQNVSVSAAGRWTLSLDYNGGEEGWASVSDSTGSGSRDGIVLSCSANAGDADRTLTIVLTSGAETASCFLVQKARTSHVNPDDKDLTNSTPITMAWMELPAMSESDPFVLYHHDMNVNGRSVRNYSFYWDSRALVARWVAYPLNNWLIDGYHSREDAWGLDPLVPEGGQPYLCDGGWGMRGYDRGHQIPQADRINVSDKDRRANVATYYGTNLTAQNADLNENIWATLEGAVRGWASKVDTLYVVTGCIVDEMSRSFAYDNRDKAVIIPDGYFKALLAYSGATETKRIKWGREMGETGYYLGIGFCFENRSYYGSTDYMNHSMSLDELEEVTGFDFFAHLPATVGQDISDRIESKVSTWWRYN